MAATDGPTTIKKYANRRLYNTGTSTYVTLEDLAAMVKRGEEFAVQDAKTGEDITHPVLTQIIFELENKNGGQTMLPVSFLRQLIAFYGDQMQMIVPSFLEQSMMAFVREQERIREQMKAALGAPGGMGADMVNLGAGPMKAMEEQARRNIELFSQAMRVFSPFPLPGAPEPAVPSASNEDLKDLKDQIAAMQKRIDALGE